MLFGPKNTVQGVTQNQFWSEKNTERQEERLEGPLPALFHRPGEFFPALSAEKMIFVVCSEKIKWFWQRTRLKFRSQSCLRNVSLVSLSAHVKPDHLVITVKHQLSREHQISNYFLSVLSSLPLFFNPFLHLQWKEKNVACCVHKRRYRLKSNAFIFVLHCSKLLGSPFATTVWLTWCHLFHFGLNLFNSITLLQKPCGWFLRKMLLEDRYFAHKKKIYRVTLRWTKDCCNQIWTYFAQHDDVLLHNSCMSAWNCFISKHVWWKICSLHT